MLKKIPIKYIGFAFIIILVGFAFYWFSYKPYKARKDCAWKHMHEDSKPYVPQSGRAPTTEELAVHNKSLLECKKDKTFIGRLACEDGRDSRVVPLPEYHPAEAAVDEKNWWAQTSEDEYLSCLRGKGY